MKRGEIGEKMIGQKILRAGGFGNTRGIEGSGGGKLTKRLQDCMRLLMRSWERIFDLELLKKHSEWMGGETIQACIEKIYMDEVVNVTYFKAR